jgi:hypothetical protein
MKRFAVALLLLAVCATPVFAHRTKIHKDPRAVEHPKAYHQKNEHFKQRIKVKKHKKA